MRFFLDQDVDVAVARFIRGNGHDCWTAYEAGRSAFADDGLSVYAEDKHAVIVSHDAEFGRRRRTNPIGRHLWLKCQEPDAVDVLDRHWDAVLELLEAFSDVTVRVSSTDVLHWTRWQ